MYLKGFSLGNIMNKNKGLKQLILEVKYSDLDRKK